MKGTRIPSPFMAQLSFWTLVWLRKIYELLVFLDAYFSSTLCILYTAFSISMEVVLLRKNCEYLSISVNTKRFSMAHYVFCSASSISVAPSVMPSEFQCCHLRFYSALSTSMVSFAFLWPHISSHPSCLCDPSVFPGCCISVPTHTRYGILCFSVTHRLNLRVPRCNFIMTTTEFNNVHVNQGLVTKSFSVKLVHWSCPRVPGVRKVFSCSNNTLLSFDPAALRETSGWPTSPLETWSCITQRKTCVSDNKLISGHSRH